jgi:Iodothyronine deiodinase
MRTNNPRFSKTRNARKWCLAVCLLIIFSGISAFFWYNELIYNLPTPVPINYRDIKPGTVMAVSQQLNADPAKPLFLHFFNPDCPCSRFNMQYFKTLVKKYSDKIDFQIVALVNDFSYTEKKIQDKFGLAIPVSFDSSLASACGVYSTPQAVIIDKRKLFFRGNYNKSRYCSDPKTNYAEIAIDSLLLQKYQLNFDIAAFTAYGCQLPNCKK